MIIASFILEKSKKKKGDRYIERNRRERNNDGNGNGNDNEKIEDRNKKWKRDT